MTIKEQLKNSLNEAKLSKWMIVDTDKNVTYIVQAESLEKAKEITPSDNKLIGWYLDDILKSKSPVVLVDSDMIKSKGDKKY